VLVGATGLPFQLLHPGRVVLGNCVKYLFEVLVIQRRNRALSTLATIITMAGSKVIQRQPYLVFDGHANTARDSGELLVLLFILIVCRERAVE